MATLDVVSKWIALIPGTGWSYIGGVLATLLSVWLTGHVATKNVVRQLSHDREMRSREREMALRKEIYLAAMEAISAGFTACLRFADLRRDGEKSIAPYVERAPAIAKVYIVAGADTLRTMFAIQSGLDAAFIRLSTAKVPAVESMRKVATFTKAMGKAELTVADLTMFAQSFREMAHSQLQIMELVINETISLNSLLVPLVNAVRAELNLSIDKKILHEIVTEGVTKQIDVLRAFMAEVRATISSLPKSQPGEPALG